MNKRKIFILDQKFGQGIYEIIREINQRGGYDVEINLSIEEGLKELPRDYWMYILHTSEVPSNFLEIVEEQPTSIFVGVERATAFCWYRESFNRIMGGRDWDLFEGVIEEFLKMQNQTQIFKN